MKIEIAAVADVDRIWPLIAKDIQAACERSPGELTAGWLWKECRSGHTFLVLVHDDNRVWSASVLDVEFDAWRVLIMTGSNMKAWFKDYFELVQRIARENGAKRLVTRGRRGWLRLCGGVQIDDDEYEVAL